MREMSATTWRRRGSSVVFDKHLLGPLIDGGCLVSLRAALGWLSEWPGQPPGDGDTVLVGGLETCLELMPPAEGEEFLRQRVKSLIQEFQSRWDQRGLVFGFGCSPKRFRLDAYENVLFTIPGGGEVRLSAGLWNGAAQQDMYQLLVTDAGTNQQVVGGYYVRRLS